MGKPRERSDRGGVEKNGVVLLEQYEQVFRAEPSTSQIKQSWGCTGFDAVIGKSWLRVRALFSVINEHLKETTIMLFHLLEEHKL